MSVFSSDGTDTKWEFLGHIIDELTTYIDLVVPRIDSPSTYTLCIISRGALVFPDNLIIFVH